MDILQSHTWTKYSSRQASHKQKHWFKGNMFDAPREYQIKHQETDHPKLRHHVHLTQLHSAALRSVRVCVVSTSLKCAELILLISDEKINPHQWRHSVEPNCSECAQRRLQIIKWWDVNIMGWSWHAHKHSRSISYTQQMNNNDENTFTMFWSWNSLWK